MIQTLEIARSEPPIQSPQQVAASPIMYVGHKPTAELKSMPDKDFCTIVFKLSVLDSAVAKSKVELTRTLAQLKRDESRFTQLADLAKEVRADVLELHKRRRRCTCPSWIGRAA